jgi:hypothetical protein
MVHVGKPSARLRDVPHAGSFLKKRKNTVNRRDFRVFSRLRTGLLHQPQIRATRRRRTACSEPLPACAVYLKLNPIDTIITAMTLKKDYDYFVKCSEISVLG